MWVTGCQGVDLICLKVTRMNSDHSSGLQQAGFGAEST